MVIFLYYMRYLLLPLALFLLGSCSVPDLSDPTVLADAKTRAIELKLLERKFMYGMFHLFVDEEGKPFTGWVKSMNPSGQISELGYLIDGRKEGLWISWNEQGNKLSEIFWAEDRMEGPFKAWHPNGQVKVAGQTRDGEVDGPWTEYYASGQIAYQSVNRIGHLVEISVWRPDGTLCSDSRVRDGNGTFLRYFENGSVELKRAFVNGVETSRETFDQR